MFWRWGWGWVHLERRPLFSLLYQPQMMNDDECWAVGVMSGKGNRSTPRNLAHCHFVHHKFHLTWLEPGSNPGRRVGKLATKGLSYGTAIYFELRDYFDSTHICIKYMSEQCYNLHKKNKFRKWGLNLFQLCEQIFLWYSLKARNLSVGSQLWGKVNLYR
jgi:hypothetical protein